MRDRLNRLSNPGIGKLGHDVDLASSGQEAIAAVARRGYALVFMDLQMPDMDGYAATRAIRSLAAPANATPIVALTANTSDEDRQSCFEAGMNGFTTKPVNRARLEAVIDELAVGSQMEERVAEAPAAGPGDIDAEARDALRAEVGGDCLRELDAQFMLDIDEILPAMRQAIVAGDLPGLRAGAHTLRGAAGNLGHVAIVRATDAVRAACHEPATQHERDRAMDVLTNVCRRSTASPDRCDAKRAA